jgi:hypothetical protein
MGTLVVFFVLALILATSLVLGAGWLAIVPAVAALGAAVWMIASFAKGRSSPARAVRRTDSPELLGPGGPDDPERAA